MNKVETQAWRIKRAAKRRGMDILGQTTTAAEAYLATEGVDTQAIKNNCHICEGAFVKGSKKRTLDGVPVHAECK